MKILISEVKYSEDAASDLPTSFEFDIDDIIANDDNSLSIEVFKLVKEKTNHNLIECTVDVE